MNPSDPSVIEDWLKNFTYKPGFVFEYFPPHRLRDIDGSFVSMHPGVVKIWTPHWEDSRMPGRTSQGVFTFQINWYLFSGGNGEEHFKRWLRQQVHYVELHEADEWLRYNGELEWDPHASNRR